MTKLCSPCAYQGAKTRIAPDIINYIRERHVITKDTIFIDCCCGSGSISLEFINQGFNPHNIYMIDNGCWGDFWDSIDNNSFDINIFESIINDMPEISQIQLYLKDISLKPVKKESLVYYYLILQSGAFGSKQIALHGDKWSNASFRSYWKPTETSNRRTPVNPMMPMPETLYGRVKAIVEHLSGKVNVIKCRCEDYFAGELPDKDIIIYCDPPYFGRTPYKDQIDLTNILNHRTKADIYISEGYKMADCKEASLISNGRKKGNISGNAAIQPVEEWINRF